MTNLRLSTLLLVPGSPSAVLGAVAILHFYSSSSSSSSSGPNFIILERRRRLTHLLHRAARLHEVLVFLVHPRVSAFFDRLDVALIGFGMQSPAFSMCLMACHAGSDYPLVFVIALVDDVVRLFSPRSLNVDCDASDELVHDVLPHTGVKSRSSTAHQRMVHKMGTAGTKPSSGVPVFRNSLRLVVEPPARRAGMECPGGQSVPLSAEAQRSGLELRCPEGSSGSRCAR